MRDFHLPGRSTVYAERGMCATSHPLAAATAIDTLKAGGNAVDAAIAAAVLLGICEPQMTGIGGDAFALVHPGPDQPILALNASGRAPAALSAAALRARGFETMPTDIPEAVTIPGAVDGFFALSGRFGRLGMDRLLAPAIDYAERGVPVAPRTAFDWADEADRLQGAGINYYLRDGRALRPGEVFRAPQQAQALRRIAAQGPAAFYEGEIAEDMLAGLGPDAPHRLEDFAASVGGSDWGEPVTGRYKGWEIVEHPPNGQGAAALLLLDIIARLKIENLDPLGAARAHLEAEATKLAYDARNRLLADPAHMPDPAALQAPGLASELAATINPTRALPRGLVQEGAPHRDTIYITVVDENRMAVSLIYSIFASFGTGIASPKFGILMHNRGSGFSLSAGHPNEAAGGKRPMHTIIPGMVRQGPHMGLSFGVMGGPYQAAGHARLITNLVDYGMELQDALDAPRTFAFDGALRVERGYSDAVRADLQARGHEVVVPAAPIGGAQAIAIDGVTGLLTAASDPRKDGIALGY
ncbi:MAG: gamma-glutamyltransferase family protein [Pseudomonadota bacterium]